MIINTGELSSNCSKLKSKLFSVLNGLITADYISKGGDPDVTKFHDFITLFREDLDLEYLSNETEPSICNDIPHHIHLEIAYAQIEPIEHMPIDNIVGAAVRYKTLNRSHHCYSSHSNECESIVFPLTSSVNFVRLNLSSVKVKRYWYLGDVDYCKREFCWEEILYPFTSVFTSDTAYDVYIWSLSIVIALTVVLLIPTS